MKIESSIISNIDVEVQDSWTYKLFLSFDIDWAGDEVVSSTIDIVELSGHRATWFITHQTDIIDRLRENDKFELGIHPNFNFLLIGDFRNGRCAEEVVDRMLAIVPEARSVRSHSTTQSSLLHKLYVEKGLTHESNYFLPEQSGIVARPWRLWNRLNIVPYCYSDEVACLYEMNAPMEQLKARQGLKIFDFHPIHVFLNTEHLDRYERTRQLHRQSAELIKYRYEGNGTRTNLLNLLELDA